MKCLQVGRLRERVLPAILVWATALALLFSPAVAGAIDWSEYEYEPGEGLHEEEWYDPSDWFDTGGGIDYERDWYDYTYNYPYGYETYPYGYYPFGYYGEPLYDYDGDGLYDYEYDYYTDEWYDEDWAF